ncbi:hypothetical protein V6N11_051153 [Hibiscus sabdariffa]|uniref:Uncharacterized protein n=1 Tax=Hibiscus sabdariffa TaxID=183260 RepID=A0ABR2R3F7_9ROSI
MSYANAVGSLTWATSGNREDVGEWECDPNKVEVLDEDCVIDRTGKFRTIEFSERVHKQIDSTMRNVIIVRLLGRNIGESGEAVEEQRIESGGDMANERGDEALERVNRNSIVVTAEIHKVSILHRVVIRYTLQFRSLRKDMAGVVQMGLFWGRHVGAKRHGGCLTSGAQAARSESTCGSTRALVNQDGALEPIVSGDVSSAIRTIVPAAGLGIEGKGSVADQ